MSKLEECILGDLVEFQRGYDLPKSKFVEGKYPVQSSNGILGYHNEYKVEGPGITIGRSGTVGTPHLIRENFFPHNTSLFVKEFKGNDIEYIYYLLQYLDLGNQKSGSGVPTMNRNHLHPIKIRAYRDKTYQQRTIKILSLIDKKIQINNQINQELEAMAKTLYDYWFVQFDFPDQNGKPYKSSGGKMVYHPELKREIPEGWGVAKVEDIAQTGSGGTPKSTNVSYYSNGEIPWINSGELEQTVITSTSNFITEEGLNNSSAKLFPSGTILVAMYGATAGKVSFLTFEASTNQAICAIMLNDIRMRYYLKNVIEDLYQYLVKLSTGSARDNLSQDMIKNIKVVIPSNDILDRYYDFSNNIIKEITKKQQENEQLTQLRDWLLPMLMNGQVKVE
ncbi:Type I restriction-modification system, specificity subunit S [Streptococcus thermophilus]|uniref:restriction endonuclease subunit S n=1 Tax=Streptococcus thermophilus TaxID=1308 RepID=UPI0015C28C96|nr:restriction endonuclease subunit S [Streptococcus thermophilus]MCT2923052.1 restriction endonuclease subunit S [Streptococcus thermophilus]CAD0161979.1 Type I restriction-modification system, specificity subunit S [Streptococcus thermophilus]